MPGALSCMHVVVMCVPCHCRKLDLFLDTQLTNTVDVGKVKEHGLLHHPSLQAKWLALDCFNPLSRIWLVLKGKPVTGAAMNEVGT